MITYVLDNSARGGRYLLIQMSINGRGYRTLSDYLGLSLLQVLTVIKLKVTRLKVTMRPRLKYSVGWTMPDDDFSSACLYGGHLDGYYMEGGDLEEC